MNTIYCLAAPNYGLFACICEVNVTLVVVVPILSKHKRYSVSIKKELINDLFKTECGHDAVFLLVFNTRCSLPAEATQAK